MTKQPMPPPVSDDGRFWWDNVKWVPFAAPAPPISDDGRFWWDGFQWVRFAAPAPSPSTQVSHEWQQSQFPSRGDVGKLLKRAALALVTLLPSVVLHDGKPAVAVRDVPRVKGVGNHKLSPLRIAAIALVVMFIVGIVLAVEEANKVDCALRQSGAAVYDLPEPDC